MLLSSLIIGFWLRPVPAEAESDSTAMLKVGQSAPLFEAFDQDNTRWRLADLIGKKIVLLYFYPKDETPGCTAQACGLRDRMEQLIADDVQVLGVSFDSAESHKEFRTKHQLNFPLLVDIEGKLADLYGARRAPGATMDKRISFLIGKDGKIAHITDTNSAAIHISEMQQAITKTKSR